MSAATDIAASPVDWRNLALGPGGRSLIEASAGTGKTWTISVLYLRLLLGDAGEQPLSPRQIIVTTFTNAAAGELRERLRSRLLKSLQLAEGNQAGGPAAANSDDTWLHGRWQSSPAQRTADVARIKLALSELDMAPITTLHGLCRRILGDHPFASGMPFVLGDLADGRALLDEVCKDVWRNLQQGPRDGGWQLALGQLDKNFSEGKLSRLVGTLMTPGSQVMEGYRIAEVPRMDDAFAPLLMALSERKGIHVARKQKLKNGWRDLALWLADQSQPPRKNLVDDLMCADDNNRDEYLQIGALDDPDVTAAIEFTLGVCVPHFHWLADREPKLPAGALKALAEKAHALMRQRLASSNALRFDDLVTKVHDLLAGTNGKERAAELADALFQAWPVALVDEFQDTDSQQYGILDRMYRDAGGALRGRLVMIGDPKQAIYRFRGGDIHAYLRAANSASGTDRMVLGVNHRSSRAMVAAFNEWYEACGGRFSGELDGSPIHYLAVEASDRQDSKAYAIDGVEVTQPLHVHYLAECPDSLPARRSAALEACADQIAGMLQSRGHFIGGKPLLPSDIAVLLPKNAQLDQLRELLRERGVPCVTTSRASVFSTDIATELQVILHAVVHCDDLGPLRAAVATRLWGMSYADIRRLGDEAANWQAQTDVFRHWRRRWHSRGIQSVVDALIDRVAVHSLDTMQGERVLTDLRHLGELLQEQADAMTGPEELLAWLAEQRSTGGAGDEEAADARQLRIESDALRVRLMTLHVSKGLEFPVVFLPLMWDHKGVKSKSGGLCLLSDPETGCRRIESSGEAFAEDLREQQDEAFRVLYVALTRAIHACHVFALDPRRSARSGSRQADAGTSRSALDVMLARMQPGLGDPAHRMAWPHIQWLEGWHNAGTHRYLPVADALPSRIARSLPAPPPGPLPARHSFTTLASHAGTASFDPDAPAIDENDMLEIVTLGLATPEPIGKDPAIFDSTTARIGHETEWPFPSPPVAHLGHREIEALAAVRGADFGNAAHAILELRVIGQPLASQRELIRRQLALNNVKHKDIDPEKLVSLLASRLQAVLESPLGIDAGPRLGQLPASDLRTEMEFHFPLDGASMARLRKACSALGEPKLVPSGDRVLTGLMNGKIDLVFRHGGRVHVLDYKGNHLGVAIEDYQGAALAASMDKSHYRFQALLYSVAVDRFLRQRIDGYERARDMGDCWYVFIRAVGLAPGAGVWRHRFSDALLDAVDRELATCQISEVA